MSGIKKLTDRTALLHHRKRAGFAPAYFLHDEAAIEISERLAEVNKTFTTPALVGHVTPEIAAIVSETVTVSDDNELKLVRSAHDLVIHSFGLHWADDPIGQLVQSRLALVPDGLFLGVMFAGDTLSELRSCLAEAETKLSGGLSPRILPMADLRDLGGLLQRAGFSLPVADSRKITVRYRDLTSLVRDLRGMGETNALHDRLKRMPPRALFAEAEALYRAHFSDEEGFLLATFEMVFLTGWAPDPSQQKPMRPGSASARLADALGVDEKPAGDQVG